MIFACSSFLKSMHEGNGLSRFALQILRTEMKAVCESLRRTFSREFRVCQATVNDGLMRLILTVVLCVMADR